MASQINSFATAPNSGFKAKSPYNNVPVTPNTLPTNQVSTSTPTSPKPVNSFATSVPTRPTALPPQKNSAQPNIFSDFNPYTVPNMKQLPNQGAPTLPQLAAQTQATKTGANTGGGGSWGGTTSASAPNITPAVTTVSTGAGTGGGRAPAGMEYDGFGRLVPLGTGQGTGNVGGIGTSGSTGGGTVPPGTGAGNGQTLGFDPNNSGLYGQLIAALANKSNQPSADYLAQQQQANQYNEALKQSRMNEAQGLAANASNPIPLEFQQGRGQVLQSQYAQEQAALGAGFQGASNLLGAANTQQGLQLSGLGSAAGLAAPVTGVPYGTQTLNRITGQPMPGTGGDFNSAMSTYAQALANNQASAIPGSITSNPVLMAQLLEQAKHINPGFNYNTAQGVAQGQQQVGATGGAIQSQQVQQVAQYRSALQQGQNLQAQLSDLIKTFGLNPADINAANSGLQVIARNTSDPHYKQLLNYVNDIANTYAQILTPPGGSATDTTRGIASSMLDATASGASIMDTMKSLDNAAQAKIAGVPTQNGTSGSTSSTGGLTFGNFF